MADKLSDKEIERRKQQAAQNAAAPKPHENMPQTKGGKHGGQKQKIPRPGEASEQGQGREKAEEGGHQWIAAAHNGYGRRHGLGYARELYLAAGGDDLRGEDRLTGRSDVPFAVRFHLHPSVEPAARDRVRGVRQAATSL